MTTHSSTEDSLGQAPRLGPEYSRWGSFSTTDESRALPGIDRQWKAGRFVPVRHDGCVIGNGLVLGVVGWKTLSGVPLLSSMSFIDASLRGRPLAQLLADEQASERELVPASSAKEAAAWGAGRHLPAQDFVLYRGGEGCFASDLPSCVCRRLRKTGVWVTTCEDEELSLRIVDFAPLAPALPVLVRMVTITALRPLAGGELCCFLKDPSFRREGESLARTADGSALVVHSPGGTVARGFLPGFAARGSWITQRISALPPGLSVTFPFYFGAGAIEADAVAAIGGLHATGPEEVLRKTIEAWKWELAFDFASSDDRLADLVQGIQVLLLSQRVEDSGFWAGVGRYPVPYLRDNYYVARGLLDTGHHAAVQEYLLVLAGKLEEGGVVNILRGRPGLRQGPITFWNDRNEAPFYAALLFCDYWRLTGDDAPLASALPELVRLCRNRRTMRGLSMSHGDETHHWTTPDFWVNAGSCDTSMLELCVVRFLIDYCRDHGNDNLLAVLEPIERELSEALRSAWMEDEGHYPAFVLADGSKDPRPFLTTLLLGFYVGLHSKHSEDGAKSLGAAIRHLGMANGLPMSNPDYPIYAGNNPGLVLYALAEADHPAGARALAATMDLATATGNYIEYYDVYAHRACGEPLRAFEGACNLSGIVHYLFGIQPRVDGIRIKPHLPSGVRSIALSGHRLAGAVYSISVEDDLLRLTLPNAALWVRPACEVEAHERAGEPVFTLRPAEEAAPEELQCTLEMSDRGARFTPGGFSSLELEVRLQSGKSVSLKQEVAGSRVTVTSRGKEPVEVRGRSLGREESVAFSIEGPVALSAGSRDFGGARTGRLLYGESIRIAGWARRGAFPCDCTVRVSCGDMRVDADARGGRFEAVLPGGGELGSRDPCSRGQPGTTAVGVAVGDNGARTALAIAIEGRDVLAWKHKALAGFGPCIVCRPACRELAEVLAMEMSLLVGYRVSVVESERAPAAIVLKPSSDQVAESLEEGDLAMAEAAGGLPDQIQTLLRRMQLAWKQVPLLTTDEWKIKATRYPFLVASRSLGEPGGKIPVSVRCERPARVVLGRAVQAALREGTFDVDLDRVEDGAVIPSIPSGDLALAVFHPMPGVKQLAIACGPKANRYTIRLVLPARLRVVDPSRMPNPEWQGWRGSVQTLTVTRDPRTLCQQVEAAIEIEEGTSERIALPLISL